jgi:hypothetical protein
LATEWTGVLAEPARVKADGVGAMPSMAKPSTDIEVTVRKPSGGHGGH